MQVMTGQFTQKTHAQFLLECKNIHGERYDYSMSNYRNCKEKVKIICKTHGVFEQAPNTHLRKRGCPKCGNCWKKTREEFIKDAIAVHGNKYNYDQVVYTGAKYHVTIVCPTCGPFDQKAGTHLHGKHGCPSCHTRTSCLEAFIRKSRMVHGDKYSYDHAVYQGGKKKLKIICPFHGEFMQNATTHLMGHGCRACSSEFKRFSIDKEAFFYAFSLKEENGEEWVGFGITNHAEQRITHHKKKFELYGYQHDLILMDRIVTGDVAMRVERDIIRMGNVKRNIPSFKTENSSLPPDVFIRKYQETVKKHLS